MFTKNKQKKIWQRNRENVNMKKIHFHIVRINSLNNNLISLLIVNIYYLNKIVTKYASNLVRMTFIYFRKEGKRKNYLLNIFPGISCSFIRACSMYISPSRINDFNHSSSNLFLNIHHQKCKYTFVCVQVRMNKRAYIVLPHQKLFSSSFLFPFLFPTHSHASSYFMRSLNEKQ